MLLPTLDALAFLHRQNLVHGQLKPANLMVVDDQLKLSSDTVSPAGEPRAGAIRSSVYDPPEAVNGTLSPAGDIWGLAITMVEALTQRVPEWPDEQSEIAQLPTSLPPTFADTAQRCLRRDPAGRPTATELIAEFKPTPPAPTVAIPRAIVPEAPAIVREASQTASPQSPKQRWLVPSIAGALVLLVAIWAGSRLFQSQPKPSAPSAAAAPTVVLNPEAPLPVPPRPVSRPDSPRSDQPAPVADSSPAVIHKHIPVVPRSARRTIRGRIKVAVLVTVDRSGKVVDAPLEIPGSSRYFARLATEAARKWRFASDNQDSRQWLVTFEFSRGGTTARATPRS
jgi:TonB family protein